MNNGSCIDQIDGYLCLCPKNFFGSQCESKVNTFEICICRSAKIICKRSLILGIIRRMEIFLSLCTMANTHRFSSTINYSSNSCWNAYPWKSSISWYLSTSFEWKRSNVSRWIQYDSETSTWRAINLIELDLSDKTSQFTFIDYLSRSIFHFCLFCFLFSSSVMFLCCSWFLIKNKCIHISNNDTGNFKWLYSL